MLTSVCHLLSAAGATSLTHLARTLPPSPQVSMPLATLHGSCLLDDVGPVWRTLSTQTCRPGHVLKTRGRLRLLGNSANDHHEPLSVRSITVLKYVNAITTTEQTTHHNTLLNNNNTMKLSALSLAAVLGSAQAQSSSATTYINEIQIMEGHQKRSQIKSPLPHT